MPAHEQPYHHGSLRQELLASAEATLERDGVDKLSLRQLAREAGVSHAAPGKHFRDRQALLDALAESAVTIQAMPLGQFRNHLKNLPEPVHTLMLDLAKAQRQQIEVAVSRLAKDADARFAEWLLRHAEPADSQGSMAVILKDRKRLIAAQLGIAPETFSRVLKHLRDRKLISGGGRVLNLLDPTGLQSLAGI